MRNLFLLLVLMNLGVLAWVRWIDPAPAPIAAYDGPGITLLRELDPEAPIIAASRAQLGPDAPTSESALDDPSVDTLSPSPGGDDLLAVTVNEPVEPTASSVRCVAVGPFTEAAQAEAEHSGGASTFDHSAAAGFWGVERARAKRRTSSR